MHLSIRLAKKSVCAKGTFLSISSNFSPHVNHTLSLQTAVDVFKRIILEAEKIDGAASHGKSSCSVM